MEAISRYIIIVNLTIWFVYCSYIVLLALVERLIEVVDGSDDNNEQKLYVYERVLIIRSSGRDELI